MNNSIVSIIISTCISLLTFYYTYSYNKKQLQHIKNKIFEEINVELIKQRIESYSTLMSDLVMISSLEIKNLSKEELIKKAEQLIQIIQKNIFGKIGLLASHETREIILRLRSKSKSFIEGKIGFEEVHLAAMEVHQILRSDLGLYQPGLLNIIEKLQKGEIAGKKEQIEEIAKGMNHIKW